MKSSCIENKQNVSNHKNQSKLKKKRYLIQNTNNFQYYASLKMLVSEPLKYFALHAVIICGMIYFYVLSFVTGLIVLQLNYAIVALHIVVFILLLILGFKNPGIILKISEDFDSKTKIHIPFDRDSKPAINQMAKSFTFPLKSHFITLKFCPQCLIYKPPRTVHCWICNACVQKMDHHCPFIGNCVGKGNYQIFFCFVTLLGCKLILIMSQLIILIVRLFQNNHEVAFEKPELYFAVILFLFTLIALIFVGSLGSFHLYLIINNLTTNQLCKQTWDSVSGNPFKKNFCLKNVFRFISGPTNQKLLDPTQNLQKSMVPRFKDKSEQFLSSYENSQPVIFTQTKPLSVLKRSQLYENKSEQIIQKQEGAITQQQILNISGKHQI